MTATPIIRVLLVPLVALVALAPFSGGTGRGLDAPTQATVAPPQPDVLSPLAVSVIAPPHPVLGADNRMHLAYELVLINQSSSFFAQRRCADRPRCHERPSPR